MASVNLPRLFLQSATDPDDLLTAYTGRDVQDTRSVPVEVRRMANGRTRTVSRAGTSRTLDVTLRVLSDADVSWLESHAGRLVLLRDPSGRKVFGVYGSVAPVEYRDRSGWDCPITLTEVSYDEAV